MYRWGQFVFVPVFPANLGFVGAGIVDGVGPGVAVISEGDAVSVIPAFSFADYGMYGEVVCVPAHAVVKHPSNLSFTQAAAAWMMFVTAYGALVDIAGLSAGDTVLIPAASSSVGLAAIQIANLLGATPIALTRNDEKRAALLESGAAHVITSSSQDIVEEIHRLTGGRGSRMVFDPVGGPNVAKLVRTLGMNGMFVLYGALDTRDMAVPVMDVLSKHLTLRGYELFEITGNATRMEDAKRFISDGLATGRLTPVIDRVFAFEELPDAHRYMASNQQVGKIVVNV
jgi:NADPH:quinone reductase-like Zn-dependent oxidoreductase